MEFKELKKAFAAEARAAGICPKGYNDIMKVTSKEQFVELYFRNLDFVQEHDYPSELIWREFHNIRQHYNIYRNENFSVRNPRRLVAYTGAQGKAEFTDFAVAQVWARQGAAVQIEASGCSYVTLDVAQGATAHIKATGKSSVTVFLHGGKVTQEATEDAVITIKEK